MYKKRFTLLLISFMVFTLFIPTALASQKVSDTYGEIAYRHLQALSNDIGQRVTGTEGSEKAKDYIDNAFKEMGYETAIQDFSFTRSDTSYSSSNVIATKPGKSSKQIIVGGHYDSVSVGRGADDSASGIAVILEAARFLKDINTPYTIKFIAFGAEENGLKGSRYYVSQMSQKEIDSTVVMINLDSLAVGDKMYVYGEGDKGWFRDKALQIAKKLDLAMETNPGLNSEYPVGTTGDWSDHAPFKAAGIPYAYFESTNWELGELDGYTQTIKDGEIWHTANDTMEYIEANYPGRIQEHLNTFVQVLEGLLQTSRNNISIQK